MEYKAQKAAIEETKRLINKNIVKADDWDVKWDKIEHIRENREYDLKDRLDIIQPVYDALMEKRALQESCILC
ncbi:hypothetical protein BMS3Bbin07_00699 [bacterium BMS3Bbin07]|nr:hypothetical protein BMS3Bbin07_00699 [bacterium BMS3Bbin07]HDH52972.1 hypothetical protein [Nitrospirota bacterium]